MMLTPKHAETIAPERAAEILRRNTVNRPLRDTKVKDYALRLERGEWKLNGATIGIDENDNLVDGQHRLEAIKLSGISMQTFVITGLASDIRPTVDGGLMRVFADDLAIIGVTDSLHKAAILRKAVLWDRAHGLASLGGENVTRSNLMELWPKYETAIEDAATAKKYALGSPVTSGAASFIWWLLATRYESSLEVATEFFGIIRDGSQAPNDHMLVRLRKFLETPIFNPRTGRRKAVTAKHEIYYLILAWNAWLEHERSVQYRIPAGGLSDPYPKPHTARAVP